MEDLGKVVTSKGFYESIIVIILLFVILTFIKQVLIKNVAYKTKIKNASTFLGMVFNILQYVVIILSIFIILTINGVNVTGMLAGLGVAATIIGLSLQDTFKDLFAGINIYGNNYYKVGDYVKYNGEVCEVKFFNARVTKFRSISTNASYTVSNSTINSIEKVKDTWTITFWFDTDVDKKKIDKALLAATKVGEETDGSKSCKYHGLCGMSDNGYQYCIIYQAHVTKQYSIKLAIYNKAYEEFEKAGIHISTNQDLMVKLQKSAK